jgi:hypothetical protein
MQRRALDQNYMVETFGMLTIGTGRNGKVGSQALRIHDSQIQINSIL